MGAYGAGAFDTRITRGGTLCSHLSMHDAAGFTTCDRKLSTGRIMRHDTICTVELLTALRTQRTEACGGMARQRCKRKRGEGHFLEGNVAWLPLPRSEEAEHSHRAISNEALRRHEAPAHAVDMETRARDHLKSSR